MKVFSVIRVDSDPICLGVFSTVKKAEKSVKIYDPDPIIDTDECVDENDETIEKNIYTEDKYGITQYRIERQIIDEL